MINESLINELTFGRPGPIVRLFSPSLGWGTRNGHRSSMSARSKHRALQNYFSVRICYMFLMSKRREDWDPGLCTFVVLASREPLRSCDFWKNRVGPHKKKQSLALRSISLYVSTPKVHRPRSRCPWHFDIRNIYQIRTEKQFSRALRLLSADILKRWPHVCHVKITCTLLLTKRLHTGFHWEFHVRSRNTQPPPPRTGKRLYGKISFWEREKERDRRV